MNLELDTISYCNHFRDLPASFKIIVTFTFCILAYIGHAPVQALILVGVFAFLLVGVKVPWRFLLRSIVVPSLFLVVGIPPIIIELSRAIDMNSEVLLSLFSIGQWQFYVSKSGVELAYAIILRALSLFVCVLALLVTTPFNEIVHSLSKVGIPQVLLDILVSMYRFIFIFLEYATEMSRVVKSRRGTVTRRRTLQSVGLVIVQLFAKTFERYQRMALMLESRRFTEKLHVSKSKYEKGSLPTAYIWYVIMMIAILIGVEWWCRSS